MPIKAQTDWNGAESNAYLKSRGLPAPQAMPAQEAKRQVTELFRRSGGPPEEVIPEANTVDARDMRRLWWSCSVMFKDLMRIHHDASTINRTMARVQAFLSDIEALDIMLHPARTLPLYLAKYNFPSLMRAVSHLQRFGNIRDLHEGGIEGEAIVKVLRPLVPKGLKDNFAKHLLRKALRDKTLDRLLSNLECDQVNEGFDHLDALDVGAKGVVEEPDVPGDDEEDDDGVEEDHTVDPFLQMRRTLADVVDEPPLDVELGVVSSSLLFGRYRTLAIVESYLIMGVPLSIVLTNQGGPQRMGVIVATCNEWWLLPLRVGQLQYEDDLGFTYFQVALYPAGEHVLVRTRPDGGNPKYHVQLLNYATLRPALWLEPPFPYALMTMEGDHLDANYNFV